MSIWKYVVVFLVSMVPIVELRGSMGLALSETFMGDAIPYWQALPLCVIGNMLPVPFIIIYIRKVFAWIRCHMQWLDDFVTKIENKAHLKGQTVQKYGALGLCILVAIPLPGTGAWTGALAAVLLDMRLKKALPSIFLGVLIAAAIMTAVTYGVIHIF